MAFARETPYNALPLLPPSVDLETRPILRRCIAANKALAELKGAGDVIPNQAMLINAIPLQEAKLSSEIENIVTTQDDLFRAALDESGPADPKTKEVLRYRTALRRGVELLRSGGRSITSVRDAAAAARRSIGVRFHLRRQWGPDPGLCRVRSVTAALPACLPAGRSAEADRQVGAHPDQGRAP